jgi:Asp-tRNA(Asn)/Glu-tRNA(Gln) amidotransferase A subunit family amidase
MAPLALGTQTNGSVIRPASFCGVVGFKPSRGLLSRRGVLTQSPTFDTVGCFARSVEDAALLTDVLAGYDDRDPAMQPAGRPDLLAIAMTRPPVRPALALVRSPVWERADADVRDGFGELAAALGGDIAEVELPESFGHAHDSHRTIMLADIALSYSRYFEKDPAALSPRLRGMIEEGSTVRAVDYRRAQERIAVLNAEIEQLFERFDAFVTPAAGGEAPSGLESTGDPAFCTIWTYLGLPALTLPLLTGSNGMPVGVQLIGRGNYDGRLLRTARWVRDRVLRTQTGAAGAALGGPP